MLLVHLNAEKTEFGRQPVADTLEIHLTLLQGGHPRPRQRELGRRCPELPSSSTSSHATWQKIPLGSRLDFGVFSPNNGRVKASVFACFVPLHCCFLPSVGHMGSIGSRRFPHRIRKTYHKYIIYIYIYHKIIYDYIIENTCYIKVPCPALECCSARAQERWPVTPPVSSESFCDQIGLERLA